MANKYFLFLKPKFYLTLFLSTIFAIIPIRQYRDFVNKYETNNQGLGLGFADWFFRFQLAIILVIPFMLTSHWLNKEEQIQSFQKSNSSYLINNKLNVGISFVIHSLLEYWLYNLGTDTL